MPSPGIETSSARNGETNILRDGKALYSRYAPSASAERLAGQHDLQPRTLYLIPSPLLGYGIPSLLERLPESSFLLGIETNQELMGLSSPALAEFQRKGRSAFYRLDDPVGLYRVFTELSAGEYRSCRMIVLNGGYAPEKALYDGLFTSLEEYLRTYWQNRLTSARLGRLWIRNLIANLTGPDRADLSDFHTPRTLVLAGAGESLEGSLPLLKEARESFFLLAVDTAVQTLMRSGLRPDGVVNLESQFYNLKDFYSLAGAPVRQFADMTAYPPSLRQFPGEHYLFSSRFGRSRLIDRLEEAGLLPPSIPALGSVGVTALYVAAEIARGPIFLTGLDFSYVPGKSHAKESPFHDWARLQEGRLTGDVWYGFTRTRAARPARAKDACPYLRTDRILEGYGRQLRELALLLPGRVFDIARKGMDLGLPRLTHAQALERAKKIPPQGEGVIAAPLSRQKVKKDFIRRERERLEEILALWEAVDAGRAEPESLLPLLEHCDYLYYHFPDKGPLPSRDPGFLFRAVRSARSYLRVWEGPAE